MTTKTATESLVLTRQYNAPPARVFAAWTQAEQLKHWFVPGDDFATLMSEVDLRVGGRDRLDMDSPDGQRHIVSGQYKQIDPPRKLVFTWKWETNESTKADTLVTIELQEKDGGTELTLTHELFPDAESRDHHNKGWNGCLERLARKL